MLDWTDRHCRYLHRLITARTRLYTEMVNTGAILHGERHRHLDFNAEEHPLALQLGGSERKDLAESARIARQWGYDEVNLNCGCPSERVQRGAFGACLMAEPALVRDGVRAMVDAVQGDIPVTVKHRIGIDQVEDYSFVRDFVGTVAEGGCTVFIVHARNAWLKGLSPKENREIPPLRPEVVGALKRDFPAFTFVLNGGLATLPAVADALTQADGAMVGRAVYHNPALMADWDRRFLGAAANPWPLGAEGEAGSASPAGAPSETPQGSAAVAGEGDHAQAVTAVDGPDLAWREAIEARMVDYMQQQVEADVPWWYAARHMLGLYNGLPGARRWRQVWSDHRLKTRPPAEVARLARAARQGGGAAADADHAPAAHANRHQTGDASRPPARHDQTA